MGKGSRQRPAQVSREELDARWAATFKDTGSMEGMADPVMLTEAGGKVIDLMVALKESLKRGT
jgi:hypothetical protein